MVWQVPEHRKRWNVLRFQKAECAMRWKRASTRVCSCQSHAPVDVGAREVVGAAVGEDGGEDRGGVRKGGMSGCSGVGFRV